MTSFQKLEHFLRSFHSDEFIFIRYFWSATTFHLLGKCSTVINIFQFSSVQSKKSKSPWQCLTFFGSDSLKFMEGMSVYTCLFVNSLLLYSFSLRTTEEPNELLSILEH